MTDYYKILEVNEKSTDAEIKKSYRKLALQYHPDKNGSAGAEDRFKQIADAYSILGDAEKRREYDAKRSMGSHAGGNPFKNHRPRGGNRGGNWNFESSFDEWSKSQFKSGGFGSQNFSERSKGAAKPATDHLDINQKLEIPLTRIIDAEPIEISYVRYVIDGEFKKSEEEKTLMLHLDLRKKLANLKLEGDLGIIKIKLDHLGNEDSIGRKNIWGEDESVLMIGNLNIEISVQIPEGIKLEENNIVQIIDVPLYKAIFKGEKVRITTIFNKSYDAEIGSPKSLNNLKFNIKDQGILGKDGKIGNYTIKFNIVAPDFSELEPEKLEELKAILKKYNE
jgi:DnaJ-class molecular chaperone